MKILYINNFFTEYGGAEQVMMITGDLMRQKGHEIYYYATGKQPYYEENYEYSKYFPPYSDKRKLDIKDIQGISSTFYNHIARKNLLEYLKEVKPDVVNVHNLHFHLTYSVLDACKEAGVPVAMYIHDPRMFCPGGTLSYGETYCSEETCIKGNPIDCILKKCRFGSLKASVFVALDAIFARKLNIQNKVEKFICPSNAICELAARAGLPKEKLVVINHFMSHDELAITPKYDNKGYFLYVGRVDREKGVHTLIEAMKNLPKYIGLHIAGKGHELENLQNMAMELGLSNVIFKGYLNGEELNAEYSNCLATILPCNWFEVFGRTLLESFLRGKPVIASNIAAIPEIVEHNINGFLFEPKNVEQLSQAMNTLIKEPQKVVEMGRNGRLKVEKSYNSELFYEKYSELLIKLILKN